MPCLCLKQQIDNIEDKIDRWSTLGKQCRQVSHETIQICNDTQAQHKSMIDFATLIQSTLESGFGTTGNKDDGSTRDSAVMLNTIKELTSEDKVAAAMNVATGLTDVAKRCVEKSTQLTDLMEQGVDELPKFIKRAINKREIDIDNDGIPDGVDGGELKRSLEKDVNDVQACIDGIEHFNLKTALKVGMQAFVQLAEKAKRCRGLFDTVQKFASDVVVVTNAFDKEKRSDHNPLTTMRDAAKSMLRIIRSSALMKLLSEGAGKLLNAITRLFQVISSKVTKLWSALAYAKDCMLECLHPIQLAKELCTKTKETALNLIGKSATVSRQLNAATHFDMKAIRSLIQDGEIQKMIELASRIDDEVIECTTQSLKMIDRVKEGFGNLPPMLTADMDPIAAGRSMDDPDLPDIENDILEFESTSRALDEADLVNAPNAGIRGFTDVSQTTEKCLKMLTTLETFADKCDKTIASFVSVWDLESATNKINDMCRVVNLGELMKKYANQIQRLLQVMIKYMKGAIKKFSNVNKMVLPQGPAKLVGKMADTFKFCQ